MGRGGGETTREGEMDDGGKRTKSGLKGGEEEGAVKGAPRGLSLVRGERSLGKEGVISWSDSWKNQTFFNTSAKSHKYNSLLFAHTHICR